MENEQIIQQLTETTERSKSNTKRIDKLEETASEIKSLATSTAVMAQRLGTVEDNVSDIKSSVNELKDKPGKRWDGIVDKAVWLVLGGLITFFLTSIGLNI